MGTLYLGVDLHVRTQMVCWMDTADGEEHQRELDHQRNDVRGFYAQLPQSAIEDPRRSKKKSEVNPRTL